MADHVAAALRAAATGLAAVSDTPRLDAELLMAHALGLPRSDMLLHRQRSEVPDGFAPLIARRMSHEPVAYITGRQEFYGLDFAVTPDVLIPRADSETLVDAALALAPGARRVIDCGTGSGALLLAVLAGLPGAHGIGIDRSRAALDVAQANATALDLSGRAAMHLADWTMPGWQDGLGAPFDLVLANPPYVETAAQLSRDVRDHEPASALFAGADGLDDYRILIPQLPALLAPGGTACVEIGATQANAVSAIGEQAGLRATCHHDLAGRERVLTFVVMP